MENKIIPTAEEWLLNHKELSKYDVAEHDEGGYLGVNEDNLYKIMIEFAKLHVEAALKAAYENIEYTEVDSSVPYVVKDSILNSYPLENIK
jgi:hypothetical protein